MLPSPLTAPLIDLCSAPLDPLPGPASAFQIEPHRGLDPDQGADLAKNTGPVDLQDSGDQISRLVDSHCHLDRYAPEELPQVLARAYQAGVSACVSISTSQTNSREVLALVKTARAVTAAPKLFCAVGIHPCDVQGRGHDRQISTPQQVQSWLENVAQDPDVIALGETGLDGQPTSPPLALQEAFFRAHIAASQTTGLPLVVHTRNSDEDFLRIMNSVDGPRPRGVLHCFTGGVACAQQAVSWGWKVSFSGILTFANAPQVLAVARSLPLDSLLVETDAPWLAPASRRGQRNEPSYVKETAAVLATIHSMPFAQMARQTTQNFFDLFTKAGPHKPLQN